MCESTPTTQEFIEAFSAIEKHDLKVNTIICTVCNHVFVVSDKESKPCTHLRKLAEECKDWTS